jgi:integrase
MLINFYLDSKPKAKDPRMIIFCYVGGLEPYKTIKIHTGERIEEKFWNKNVQRAIIKGPNKYNGATELNAYLDYFEERIRSIRRKALMDNPEITYDEIKNLIEKRAKDTAPSFFDEYDKYIEIKKTTVGYRTIQRLTTVKNHLKEFQEKNDYIITFANVNLNFNDMFMEYLLTKKSLANNTASKIVKHVKEFMTWAGKRNLHKNTEYHDFKLKWNESDMVVLEEDEFNNVLNFDFKETPHLERVRDVFCFGCLTGARYGDIAGMKFTDITKGTWKLITEKTKEILYVPITPLAQKIIDKYKADGRLPVISNQKMNKHIKDVMQKAEITQATKKKTYSGAQTTEKTKAKYELIGMHTARRTFVTLSLQKGMRPEVIMQVTGHKDLRVFQKYIKINEKVKEKEMREAWS